MSVKNWLNKNKKHSSFEKFADWFCANSIMLERISVMQERMEDFKPKDKKKEKSQTTSLTILSH